MDNVVEQVDGICIRAPTAIALAAYVAEAQLLETGKRQTGIDASALTKEVVLQTNVPCPEALPAIQRRQRLLILLDVFLQPFLFRNQYSSAYRMSLTSEESKFSLVEALQA